MPNSSQNFVFSIGRSSATQGLVALIEKIVGIGSPSIRHDPSLLCFMNGSMLVDASGELMQVLDSQSRRRERTDDVAEPVHPLMRFGNDLRVVGVIGARRILSHRRVEVRNLKLQLGRTRVIAAHLRERMKLRHIEKPAGLDEAAATSAHRVISGSQHNAPYDVNTISNCSCTTSGAS